MKKYIKNTSLGLLSIATIITPIVAVSCGDEGNKDNKKSKKVGKGDTNNIKDEGKKSVDNDKSSTKPKKDLNPALKIPQTFDESKSKRLFRELQDKSKSYDELKQLLDDYNNSDNSESWFEGKWSSEAKEKQFMAGGDLPTTLFLNEPGITELHIGSNITDLGNIRYNEPDKNFMWNIKKLTFARNGKIEKIKNLIFQFINVDEIDLTPLYNLNFIAPDSLLTAKMNVLRLPKSFDLNQSKNPFRLFGWPEDQLEHKKVFKIYAYYSYTDRWDQPSPTRWETSDLERLFGIDRNYDIYEIRKYIKIFDIDGNEQVIYE